MDQSIQTTCIEEIWQEFPGFSQYEVRSALAKCGLTTKHIESLVKVLSGGEQAKVRLCKLINRPSNILLLDEPTNLNLSGLYPNIREVSLWSATNRTFMKGSPQMYGTARSGPQSCSKCLCRGIDLHHYMSIIPPADNEASNFSLCYK